MNLDISGRGVYIFTATSTIVHLNFLHQYIGQISHSSFRGRVWAVSSDGEKAESRRCENEMPWRWRNLRVALSDRFQPPPQRSVCSICGRPINRIHLIPQRLNRHVDEIPGMAVSSTAPDSIGSNTIIPLCSLI